MIPPRVRRGGPRPKPRHLVRSAEYRVRLRASELEEWRAFARELGSNVAQVMRDAVREYIDRERAEM